MQVIVEKLLVLQIQFAFTQGLLVSFVHVEDDLLVGIGTFEEVSNVALLLNELYQLFIAHFRSFVVLLIVDLEGVHLVLVIIILDVRLSIVVT